MSAAELYSYKEAAELFSLQETRLRYWAQTGFIGPSVRQRGRFYYSFQDLIGLKVAKELLETGLPMQRVRKNLDALRSILPQADRPLAQLRICSDGNELVVVTDDVAFQPASGQLVMSFAVRSLTARVAEVLPIRTAEAAPEPPPNLPGTALAAFQAGLEADDAGEHRRAEELYRHALALDPNLAAAWTNLGNLLERAGARGDAREAYQRALTLDPEQPEARYNLANLLADVGETELALAEYRRVTASASDFPDAHFNLAALLLRIGAVAQARGHFQRYLELDPETEWADQARALIAKL